MRAVLRAIAACVLTVTTAAAANASAPNGADAEAGGGADHAPRVQIVELGVHDTLATEASQITDSGSVFGVTLVPVSYGDERRAFRWEDGTTTELGGPTQGSITFAANERGDAAGLIFSLTGDGRVQAVVWRDDGTVVNLGTEGLPSVAEDINRRGTVVGWAGLATGATHAAIWRDGGLTAIDHQDAAGSHATAVNDRGQVVGYLVREGNGDPYRAFVHHRGVTEIFAPPVELDLVLASDINRRGEVLVVTIDKFGPSSIWYVWDGERVTRLPSTVRGARFTDGGDIIADAGEPGGRFEAARIRDGVVVPLGTLGGSSSATAGNRRGQVVGWAELPDGNRHAVLYDGGALVDLGTLGGASSEAVDIDRHGRVVGWAEDADGVRRAVMWLVSR